MTKRTILITGSTSGIGRACAIELAKQNQKLILHGRDRKKLNALCYELQSLYQCDAVTVCFDITDIEEIEIKLRSLPKKWSYIEVLINNAGLALGKSSFESCSFKDWDKMIDVNVKGLLYITHYVTNHMFRTQSKQEQEIVNISSIAGTQVYKGGNVYCASKHAVDAITRSLRIDLLDKGIKVSSISPGNVQTNFANVRFKGDKKIADAVYEGYSPLQPEDVADALLFILSRPSRVNINDIEITPKNQANVNYVKKKMNKSELKGIVAN